MKQAYANTLVAASVVMFCIVLGVWLSNFIGLRRGVHGFGLVPSGHNLLDPPKGEPQPLEEELASLKDNADVNLSFLGFHYQSAAPRPAAPTRLFGPPTYWAIIIPYWFLLVLCSAAPVWLLHARRRRNHRAKNGLCPTCGYDLRGTPDRCPECGAVPAGSPAVRTP